MTDCESLLHKLRELDAKATPGPWRVMRDGNQYVDTRYVPTAKLVGASRIDGVLRPWNPHAAISLGMTSKQHEEVRFADDDADLVAELRNAVPLILEAIAVKMAVDEKLQKSPTSSDGIHGASIAKRAAEILSSPKEEA